ncbi:MAG: Por secretion system protein, partial [Muribaculaceae bacterium]|nr:Por secretion system protein [Muribaculaceae bacterium]
MVKNYLMMLVMLAACAFGVSAQVVTTEPTPLQEDATDVKIYFHADEGDKGLMGQPADAALYAHAGVHVIGADGKVKEWQYAPSWEANNDKYRLQYVSENLWMLPVGNMREYYGIAPEETITKLAFVFRNANGSKTGRDTGGQDIFVDVMDAGLQIAMQPSYMAGVVPADKEVKFTVSSTEEADLVISVNDTEIASAKGVTELVGTYTFTAVGDYTVKATATQGEKSVSTELGYCVAGASQPATSSVVPPMGAYRNADGTVTFCIAAPEKETAMIVGSWNDYKLTSSQVMQYVEGPAAGEGTFRYFTITLSDIPKDEPVMYYYVIDRIAVGDPYARLVLDPWNDKYIGTEIYPLLPAYPFDKVTNNVCLAVFQDNLGDYEWKVKDFKGASKDNLIIYELLFRDFTGTEGKALGNGTVRQAIEKIPYLVSLGVNAVELLPINEFNGNISWGYNPNFYFAIDKAYGTPEDYKEFIDICHENGIAVILDVVFNQSDGQHPWYKLYSISKNPFYNKTAPHAYSVLNDWNQG